MTLRPNESPDWAENWHGDSYKGPLLDRIGQKSEEILFFVPINK